MTDSTRRATPAGRRRAPRGSALILVLVFTTALAMLALSAIYLTSGATIVGRSYERERDLRYVAEAGLALGKSRLNSGASVLPATGFTQIITNQTIQGADGEGIPDIRLNVFVGPTGGGAGSRGRFASVVAEARDALGGGRFVRQVELAEESFARFAYFTDQELSSTGTEIFFGRGDVLLGPVWSNDNIRLTNSGTGPLATFRKDVGTAGRVVNPSFGIFDKRYRENQPAIALPDVRMLSGKLRPLAAEGLLNLNARRADTLPSMRVEFFAMDMNSDGDSTDANEGFFKVYEVGAAGSAEEQLKNAEWLAGAFRVVADPRTGDPVRWSNCGDWHQVDVGGATEWQFFPLEVHATEWFNLWLQAGGGAGAGGAANRHSLGRKSYPASSWPSGYPDRSTFALPEGEARPDSIMNPPATVDLPRAPRAGRPRPRCFLGGDPHLIASSDPSDVTRQRGGTATTFYATDREYGGAWLRYPGGAVPAVAAARAARGMADAAYVFPLHPDFNRGSLGVIHVAGSVGVSGVVNGGVTLYAENTAVILDDITYATNRGDPSRACNDILGLIAAQNALLADNGLNTPQDVDPIHTLHTATTPASRTLFLSLDNPEQPDVDVQMVSMALATSFRVQGFSLQTYPLPGGFGMHRPVAARNCAGQTTGRGCINLFGGLIQKARGQVARSGGTLGIFGFAKQYDYDPCSATNPPPFFPTIGRFIDNRYYEVDPLRFRADSFFAARAPRTGAR